MTLERYRGYSPSRVNRDAKYTVTAGGDIRLEYQESRRVRVMLTTSEHADLVDAITSGKHVNESEQLADSTLTGIMGRMSAYTGKLVTWDHAKESKLDLWPKQPLAFGPMETPPVAVPGKDPLV